MHNLYQLSHDKPVCITVYKSQFELLNLAFKKPQLDTCNLCDTLAIQIKATSDETDKEVLRIKQVEHHTQADKAYAAKSLDKDATANDITKRVYTFDLQQCLPTPYLTTGVAFYKRQLWTFNLTIHDCYSGQGFCYMWNETIAPRGGNQIASCLLKHKELAYKCFRYHILLRYLRWAK
jgi:hypothetical protein